MSLLTKLQTLTKDFPIDEIDIQKGHWVEVRVDLKEGYLWKANTSYSLISGSYKTEGYQEFIYQDLKSRIQYGIIKE